MTQQSRNTPLKPVEHDPAEEKLTDRAQRAKEQAGDMAHQAADKAKQVANDLRSKDPSTIAREARDQAGELADTARQKTAEVSGQAAERADAAMTATGERMTDVAQTLREKAPEGKAGEVAKTAADALDRSGRYLKTADVDTVRSDLEMTIRNHPVESLLVGLGLGYLLARATRR